MVRSLLIILAAFAFLVSGAACPSDAARLADLLSHAAQRKLAQLKSEEVAITKSGGSPTCTVENIAVRREFGSLTPAERKAYTDAVLCLQRKQAKTPLSLIPGARSRYDDFVGTHLNQTLTIHFTGNFLSWHRYYTWIYEQTLRNECGYQGYQPYWDWPKWSKAPQDSPIFNGDAYSMGGNGAYIPGHPGLDLTFVLSPTFSGSVQLRPGLGGGCVQTGPFANMTVNLGPIGLPNSTVGPDGGRGYNPRCLKRDVGPYCSLKYCNYTRVYNLMTKENINDFQVDLEGDLAAGDIGPHGGGHYTISGDPGADLFISPGDPAFYLHHGQIDRLWDFWQVLDPANRQNALSGTNTFYNYPPSANTTLSDLVDLGYSGGKVLPIRDLMSTTKGPFCYMYV